MEILRGPADEQLAAGIAAQVERLVGFFRRLTPPPELSPTATAALATLERFGPCRLTVLAAQAGVTQPAMSQLIRRLEEAGLAGREPDPADGRVVLVRVTAPGIALLARRRVIRARRLAVMLRELSPQDRAAMAAALPAMEALAGADPGVAAVTLAARQLRAT
jgi:DNA-binding MarR family transcriptional regulator